MRKRNIVIAALFAAAIAAVILMPKPRASGASADRPGAESARSGPPSGAPPAGAPVGQRPSVGGPGTPGGGSGSASVFSVRTAPVKKGTLQGYIQTNGDVIVDPTVDIYPDVNGKLVSLRVSLGSRVTKGEHIADIDRSVPGSSYELNPVRSTISGTIIALPLSKGATVSVSTAIARVGELDNLQVQAKIPERYVAVLRTGLKAQVSLEAYPGQVFLATVSRISPLVDPTSRTKEIRLAFDRADARINAGMFVRVRVETTVYANRVLVVENSVLSDTSGRFVFVVKPNGTTEKRTVTVGAGVDGILEITSGLSEGEIVVTEGVSLLTDGARIKDITPTGTVP